MDISISSKKYGTITFIVDDDCFNLIKDYRFRVLKGREKHHSDYIRCRFKGKEPTILLHRILIDYPSGKVIDHINGNGLDNRRSNLRIASISDNNSNTVLRKDSTTGVRGVSFRNGKYRVRIQVEGVRRTIGSFNTIEESKSAYNAEYFKIHNMNVRNKNI